MVIYVTDVKPRDDYTLLLTFENGEKRIFDCSCLFEKNVFKPLKNKGLFNSVKVQYGTAVWNDKIDIAPEFLYTNGIKA